MKKLLAVIAALTLLLSIGAAFASEYDDLTQNPAEYPYEPTSEPLRVVNCKEWVSVWSDTDKSFRLGILPAGSTVRFWAPYDDNFIWFDLVGDGGFVSWDYLEYMDGSSGVNTAATSGTAQGGETQQGPLYVVNCKEWISIWSEPSNQSTRLDTLSKGTRINANQWAPYNDDYIWFDMGGDGGFISWDYLSYNP